jgi:3-hydroxyisobutyrate dehydrogenase-like beta-hydroxyacid dehydrogenase
VAEAVTGADAVCINLYSEEQLREVMITQAGLVAVKAGALVIVHSTVSPDAVQELAAMRPDIAVLDAGFSGGPAEAEAGKLTLMVGGKESDFERARPVLSAYGEHIAHLGPLGAGMTLKLINNLTFAAHIAIAQDALRLCEANGLALDVALATLGSGSAGSTALALLARNKDPHAMIAGIRHYLDKDVAIARAGSRHMDIGVLDGATRGFARGNGPE